MWCCGCSLMYVPFQPTLPARGATNLMPTLHTATSYFNPRSPHGERRAQDAPEYVTRDISTHAPRTGSDILLFSSKAAFFYFNPRSPHGERRCTNIRSRAGVYFNPRSPHGERPSR